jgi:hypothetical protein
MNKISNESLARAFVSWPLDLEKDQIKKFLTCLEMSFCEIKKKSRKPSMYKTVSKPSAQFSYNRREKSGREGHRKSGNRVLLLIRIMLESKKKKSFQRFICQFNIYTYIYFLLQFFRIIQNPTVSCLVGWFAGVFFVHLLLIWCHQERSVSETSKKTLKVCTDLV